MTIDTLPKNQSCLIICPTDTWGGVEKNVLLRARAMSDRGHKVTILLLENTFEERFTPYSAIDIKTIPRRSSDLLPTIYWLYYKLILQLKPNCIFVPLKRDWWTATLCAYLLKTPRKVLYLGIKRDLKENLKYQLIFSIFKAHLIVNSKDLRKHVTENNKYINRTNCHLIYNGFEPKGPLYSGPTYREHLALPNDAWIIGCAGRFSRQKGFDHLPAILKGLPQNVHIVVAGGGSEAESIIKSIKDWGMDQRIHLIGNLSNMEPFYRALDCFMLPSRNEGMANVLNEAMSYGLPVISTKVPGSAELLEQNTSVQPLSSNSETLNVGKYGLVTNINDTNALTQAVLKLLNKEIHFSQENQRAKISRDHDYETMMDMTEAYLFGSIAHHNNVKN